MHKVIFIIFLFIFTPQFAFAENYNGEWRFESNNKKCSNFFKWDNTKIIIKNNKATYSISNTNGWSHEYIGKLKSNKKLNMNGLDASISGKFINNNQLEIKFTNIRETWEWVNMLSKCIATFTNAKDDKTYTPKKITKEKDREYVVFCVGEENLVYKRKKLSDCPSAMQAITKEEFCSSRILVNQSYANSYTMHAYKFYNEYCIAGKTKQNQENKSITIELQDAKKSLDELVIEQENEIIVEENKEDLKIKSLNPISKPAF